MKVGLLLRKLSFKGQVRLLVDVSLDLRKKRLLGWAWRCKLLTLAPWRQKQARSLN